jgi:cell shape-determining protein MreD
MPVLIAIPILGLLVILQSALASRVQLLQGSADLLLLALVAWAVQERVKTSWHWAVIAGLMMGVASALPPGAALVGYLAATALALAFRRLIWQVPLLAMVTGTFLGTVLTHAVDIAALRFTGSTIPWLQALNLVTLPSALLNLLLAIPMYALLGDLAKWVYPQEIEI